MFITFAADDDDFLNVFKLIVIRCIFYSYVRLVCALYAECSLLLLLWRVFFCVCLSFASFTSTTSYPTILRTIVRSQQQKMTVSQLSGATTTTNIEMRNLEI